MDNQNQPEEEGLDQGLKKLDLEKKPNKVWILIAVGCLIVLVGVFSGYGISMLTAGTGNLANEDVQPVSETGEVSKIEVGKTYGRKDEIFSSEATGVLKKGGLDGEGTHHLEREGGESQTVYITSSVVDLDQFIDRKLKVYGETFAGQKAGWLMDVGAVKVIE